MPFGKRHAMGHFISLWRGASIWRDGRRGQLHVRCGKCVMLAAQSFGYPCFYGWFFQSQRTGPWGSPSKELDGSGLQDLNIC